ncbi:MAG: inactive transglutaminase family protein [Oleiphilaceae bacterium]|nr:inactive transglutaminase family protein [Oleiphilaceae bacterium]
MNSRLQIAFVISVLIILGLGAVAYKNQVLSFPLTTNQDQEVWSVEIKLSFEATEESVRLFINAADKNPYRRTLVTQKFGPFQSQKNNSENGYESVLLEGKMNLGKQEAAIRYVTWFLNNDNYTRPSPKELSLPTFLVSEKQAVDAITRSLEQYRSHKGKALALLDMMNTDEPSMLVLLGENARLSKRIELAQKLLAYSGVHSKAAQGLMLRDRKRNTPIQQFLRVYEQDAWHTIDALEEYVIQPNRLILFQEGDEPLIEIYGGRNAELRFSMLREYRNALATSVESQGIADSLFIDFSIYSLPISEQSTFKLLLIIPLGALVVVIFRNLIGIRTSGTFMPVLIAMVFLQTELIVGLTLFVLVISIGLLLRSWLSRLNLLLVPRIASVLVFVIIIFAAIGIASHKLGIPWGLKVTFFPMIITAWTVERLSILWEEEGPREVGIQGLGSLLTAVVSYILMSNTYVADFVFLYPESLLLVLAAILAIGNYNGYRLSDLRRFKSILEHR